MLTRCYNINSKDYRNYGLRGIIVCDRWKNSFNNFVSDMGERPSNEHSLDRIDNNGNYEKANCRWATKVQQSNNKRVTDIKHGSLTSYYNKKCRCELCRTYVSIYLKNRRKQKTD
jgi:hypothetical protein